LERLEEVACEVRLRQRAESLSAAGGGTYSSCLDSVRWLDLRWRALRARLVGRPDAQGRVDFEPLVRAIALEAGIDADELVEDIRQSLAEE
jgi:hypothetical protein